MLIENLPSLSIASELPPPLFLPEQPHKYEYYPYKAKFHPQVSTELVVGNPIYDRFGNIVDRASPDVRDIYRFETDNRGEWRLALPPERDYLTPHTEAVPYAEVAVERLHEREHFRRGLPMKEYSHAENILFFYQNWKTIARQLFYENQRGPYPLDRFTEVNLGDEVGAIDFLGMGPDGRFLIFEFGSGPDKHDQVNKYADRLAELLNIDGEQRDWILPFSARYIDYDTHRLLKLDYEHEDDFEFRQRFPKLKGLPKAVLYSRNSAERMRKLFDEDPPFGPTGGGNRAA